MGLMVSDSGGGDFKLVPQGTHIAVCNQVIDVGLQETGYGDKHKVWLRWEIPAERLSYEKDGEEIEGPMIIGRFYTASLNEKATLRQDLEAWHGRAFTAQELKGFDLFNVLGISCQVTVVHNEANNGKTYANVSRVTSLPKGVDKPANELPLLRYGPDDQSQFDELPEWLRQKITDAVQPKPSAEQEYVSEAGDEFNDDIPF